MNDGGGFYNTYIAPYVYGTEKYKQMQEFNKIYNGLMESKRYIHRPTHASLEEGQENYNRLCTACFQIENDEDKKRWNIYEAANALSPGFSSTEAIVDLADACITSFRS
jgi:hypothetical protein